MAMPPAQQVQPAGFRRMTRQQTFNQPTLTASTFGQLVNFQLPQTGYLSAITLTMQATLTTGAGTPAGTFATYPALPYALIRKIRIYTSEGVELFNISGFGLQLYQMFQRYQHSQSVDQVSYLNANGRALLYTTQSGTPAQSTVNQFNAYWHIPISTDDSMMLGLMLLQSPDIRLNVDITTCNQSDTGNITGVSVTPSFTFQVGVESYTVPDDSQSQPNRRFVKLVQEDLFPFTTNGDQIYRPLTGNLYTSIAGIVENNGAQVSPANINTVALRFAQSVNVYNEAMQTNIARTKEHWGYTPPDGMFRFDMQLGSGYPHLYDPRDFFNSSQQTDVAVITNISGLTPVGAQIRFIKEQLAMIG